MPKKIRAMLLLAALVAMAVFAASNAVTATELECPDAQRSCLTPGGWTITLSTGYPKLIGGTGTTNRCPAGKWEYRYHVFRPGASGVTCNAAGLTRMNLAIPDCSPAEKKILLTNASGCKEPLLTFAVGAGDPITRFESGDQFVYAARLPFWGPRVGERSFCANTGNLGPTSVCLDRMHNPTLDCCKIQGPSCFQEISRFTVSYVFGPVKWVFVKTNPSVECFDEVYGCAKENPDDQCIIKGNKIEPTPISLITETLSGATVVAAEGECIVWAQFGEGTQRCCIVGGQQFCVCIDNVTRVKCSKCPLTSAGRCKK